MNCFSLNNKNKNYDFFACLFKQCCRRNFRKKLSSKDASEIDDGL